MRFVSDSGVEVPAVTAAQMREIDRIAVEESGPNLYQMMENAGRNLAELVMELAGQDAPAVVLAGTGGNGGGGICAARHLANHGVDVTLCLAEPDALGAVPAFQRRLFHETGGREIECNRIGSVNAVIIVDALVGYSLRGAPRGSIRDLIRWANEDDAPILSLDVPSGLDATTGEAPGEVALASWTMTLALPKSGLVPEQAGELWLADIGIPSRVYRRVGLDYRQPFDRRYYVPIRRSQ
jgi:NAD(P)H-hydrate epimerase